MLSEKEEKTLELFAEEIRYQIMRQIVARGFGHVGGSVSIADLLAVLYGRQMKISPLQPRMADRDVLVLSKGHAGPALYACLALKGYFPLDELLTLNRPPTRLPSHCDRKLTVGVDMSTGSLGQGFSAAVGAALGGRIKKQDSYAYVVLGDGECDEGQIWEAALFAAAKKLNNLIAFLDRNYMQNDGCTENICPLGDAAEKFSAFGWNTMTVDGHDIRAIDGAIEAAKKEKSRPTMIVLLTKKGKGSPAAEAQEMNHFMFFDEEAGARELRYHEQRLAEMRKCLEAAE